jgi:anti-sigma factor RsiW
MTATPETPGDAELLAYVDGLLDPARVAAVEARLAADPVARERAAAWRWQNEQILALVADPAGEPLPRRLRPTRLMRRRRRELRRLAAAVALALLAGGSFGWLAHGLGSAGARLPDAMLREAAQAHRAMIARSEPGYGLDVHDRAGLAARLSHWLDHPLAAPDLPLFGLRLVGARTVRTTAGDPAVLLAYQDGAAARLTLFVARPEQPPETVLREVESDAGGALYWAYEGLHCVLIADAAPERLWAMAQALYALIDPAGT